MKYFKTTECAEIQYGSHTKMKYLYILITLNNSPRRFISMTLPRFLGMRNLIKKTIQCAGIQDGLPANMENLSDHSFNKMHLEESFWCPQKFQSNCCKYIQCAEICCSQLFKKFTSKNQKRKN